MDMVVLNSRIMDSNHKILVIKDSRMEITMLEIRGTMITSEVAMYLISRSDKFKTSFQLNLKKEIQI
jgi:hypothetical protein